MAEAAAADLVAASLFVVAAFVVVVAVFVAADTASDVLASVFVVAVTSPLATPCSAMGHPVGEEALPLPHDILSALGDLVRLLPLPPLLSLLLLSKAEVVCSWGTL